MPETTSQAPIAKIRQTHAHQGQHQGAINADVTVPAFRFSVIAKLGKRYLTVYPLLVILYVVGSLLSQTILPQQAALYLGAITNHFSEPQMPATSKEPVVGEEKPQSQPSPAEERASLTNTTRSQAKALLGSYWLWLGFTFGLISITFGWQCLVALLDGKVSNAIRGDVFAAILTQSPQFFYERDSDRLTMIVNQYCNQCAMTLRRLLLDPVLQLIAVAVLGYTIYNELGHLLWKQRMVGNQTWSVLGVNGIWLLFAVILLFALFSPWIVAFMGKYLQTDVAATQQQNLALATLVGGAFKAPEEIQAMRAEEMFNQKHTNLLSGALKLQMAQSVTIEKINLLSGLPGSIVLAALLGLAILLESARAGGEPGTIVKVALLTPLLMGAIQKLSSFALMVSMAWPNIDLINSFLDNKSVSDPRGEAKEIEQIEPTFEVRNLVFSYKPGGAPNVLDHVSFQIAPGHVTGFVARPGQGKTTLFRLALRFYEAQQGEILVGGIRHSAFTLHSLRRHIVLMSQFPAFFYDTTRQNFLLAKPTATDDEIRSLCQRTGLWQVLEQSLGEDPLDEQFAAGAALSGGQKKLFALTRCLLRDPTLLFLDEPTTGMGPLEKFPMIEQMRDVLKGKTVVVVDHDIIWQTRFCDRFLVLSGGRIVQEGASSELLRQSGLFKELYDEASQKREANSSGADHQPTLSS